MSGWACFPPSKPGTAPGKQVVAQPASGGDPTYLDPKRESKVLKEERVLVARLRRGPGEPQNDSWGLTDDPVQGLLAQGGKRPREEQGPASIPRALSYPLGCRVASDPGGVGKDEIRMSVCKK